MFADAASASRGLEAETSVDALVIGLGASSRLARGLRHRMVPFSTFGPHGHPSTPLGCGRHAEALLASRQNASGLPD